MKKKLALTVATLACAAALAVTPALAASPSAVCERPGAAYVPAADEIPVPAEAGCLTVTGRGRVVTEPDTAYVCLGIQVRAKTLSEGRKALSDLYNKVLEAARAIDGDVTASGEYSCGYPVCESGLTAYECFSDLTLKTGNPGAADRIAAAAGDAGATRYNGVRYELEDCSAWYGQALAAAREDALAKAKALSENAELLSVSENGVYSYARGGKIVVEASVKVRMRG